MDSSITVTSWLSDLPVEVDLTEQDPAVLAPSSFSDIEMAEMLTATESGTASSNPFANRPTLSPTPPSSRLRANSPSRKILTQLPRAKPAFEVRQPDARIAQPPRVKHLRSMLGKALSAGPIPYHLQDQLQSVDPDLFEELHPLLGPSTVKHPDSYLNDLWQKTNKIYNEARTCHDAYNDESAWVKVVHSVLDASDLNSTSSKLRVTSIQTQSIDPQFLPKHPSLSLAKKADLALAFSPQSPTVKAALWPVYQANTDLALSQMTDPSTCDLPMVCGIEVKEQGGSYNEAAVQLAIWSGTGLECLRGLRLRAKGSQQDELPPFLGWTVVGHDWKLHIAWKDNEGNVFMLGPWRQLNAGTGSHAEILVLLELIRSVKEWLEEDYWTWLCRNVLDELSL